MNTHLKLVVLVLVSLVLALSCSQNPESAYREKSAELGIEFYQTAQAVPEALQGLSLRDPLGSNVTRAEARRRFAALDEAHGRLYEVIKEFRDIEDAERFKEHYQLRVNEFESLITATWALRSFYSTWLDRWGSSDLETEVLLRKALDLALVQMDAVEYFNEQIQVLLLPLP